MKVCIKTQKPFQLQRMSGQEKTVLLLVLLCRQEFLEIREIMKIQCIIGPATRSFTYSPLSCTCTQRFYLLIAISHPQSRKELNFSFYSVWSPLVFTVSLHTLRFFSGQKRPTTNWNFLFSPINHHGKKNCFTQQFSWDWFIYISLNFQGIKEK